LEDSIEESGLQAENLSGNTEVTVVTDTPTIAPTAESASTGLSDNELDSSLDSTSGLTTYETLAFVLILLAAILVGVCLCCVRKSLFCFGKKKSKGPR